MFEKGEAVLLRFFLFEYSTTLYHILIDANELLGWMYWIVSGGLLFTGTVYPKIKSASSLIHWTAYEMRISKSPACGGSTIPY